MLDVGLDGSVGCANDWWSEGRVFDPRRVLKYSLVETDHSTVILFR